MKEFFTNVKYMQLQSVAFEFISAYIRADYDAAMEVVTDSSVLSSYFPSEKKSMDDMRGYFIVNVRLDNYEIDGVITETASLVITVYFKDDAGAFDFNIVMEQGEYIHIINDEQYKAKKWVITNFDLNR